MRFSWFAVLCSALLLSGCSISPVATTSKNQPGSTAGAAIKGVVHGGQSPIVGAHVYLYAVNDTGYAGPGIAASSTNQSVSLLTTGDGSDSLGTYVLTQSDGSFSITGDYTCPSATPDTYLLAVGGAPGGQGSSNSAIVLFAGLTEKCTSAGYTSLYAVVNEVSTVAAAFAGAGFATDPYHVSTSSSTLAERGVDDAYGGLVNLETLGTGAAVTTTYGGNGTAPQAEINTLANILAACVNSGSSTSSPCTTLFNDAPNGSTIPTDTGTAILNIAHNPGANISGMNGLFSLQSANPPFEPALSSAPNDFTIAVNYTGGGLDYPWGIAIDSSDNVWVVNNGTNGPLTVLDPLGGILSGADGITTGGLFVPVNIAIDGTGDVWVPDDPSNKLSEFSSSGVANASSPFSGGGMDTPYYITVDKSNDIWVSNSSAAQLSEFSSSGSPITGSSGYPATNLQGQNIVSDTGGNIWVTSTSPGSGGIFEFNSSGQVSANSPITSGGGLSAPQGIAIDASGDVWVTNGNGSLSEFSSSGSPISGSGGYSGGGMNGPVDLAIDGAGDVWVISSVGVLSEFNSSGAAISGSNGYKAAVLDHCVALAIDGSGNLWVTNFNGTEGITEFVGVAAPVVTPIAANLMSPYGSHAVNRP